MYRKIALCILSFLFLIIVGQGPIALAVGAGGGCLDIFSLSYHFSFLSPSLWETARYRLKYCLKGPLSLKQPTNQISFLFIISLKRTPEKKFVFCRVIFSFFRKAYTFPYFCQFFISTLTVSPNIMVEPLFIFICVTFILLVAL